MSVCVADAGGVSEQFRNTSSTAKVMDGRIFQCT
eukprot:CAMPEP_0194550454 /NCGR_PEP_ID=MMETSP0253-20130528/95718_1 /TAXON_ID=2966 /ORGANISM="Noctiluca scintillans" /LENGTH=33 /DNA_ID= /DNA_START= /DNA_END= /DNA_ORIENTATION=